MRGGKAALKQIPLFAEFILLFKDSRFMTTISYFAPSVGYYACFHLASR